MDVTRGSSEPSPHTPVLLQQVLAGLHPRPGSRIIDSTIGAAGHAFEILSRTSPNGHLLGLDRDPNALAIARRRLTDFGSRVILRHGSFADLARHAAEIGWESVHGVLFDLGLSSMQLADRRRGFSFQWEAPLDMRFDPSQDLQAADLVNRLAEKQLAEILRHYGEEPKAHNIARAIVRARPITGTQALADLVVQVTKPYRGRIHPATRTFQALRIAVNDELDALRQGLEQAVQLLEPGGRLVVISFHSLEDRIVKQFFLKESRTCICPPNQPVCTCDSTPQLVVLTRKPIRAEDEEVRSNPRARSARLRIAEKVSVA
jgi:16S rRNA (cytosine1402-N4)-methyltransferase